MLIKAITDFLRLEAAGGILLLFAAIAAMVAENSMAHGLYESFLSIPVTIQFGELIIAKHLLHWINDGLMACFFFLVGLEIKREVLDGELSEPSRLVLPVLAAMGGMAFPALIYSYVNWGEAINMRGWAIPSATDIAFALGVLSLLGKRVPPALKLFLMTLAIADDLGAIVIIALFFTSELSTLSLTIAAFAILGLAILNRRGTLSLVPYLLVSLVLWVAVLKSGVHATLAGVISALFIPYKRRPGQEKTQVEKLEHDLHPTVAYIILPLFAFANTGVSLQGITPDSLLDPIPLGIAAGLFFGNQIGIFGFSWLAIKAGIARLPSDCSWIQLYSVSILCGIGFTMSLFIGSLAFEGTTDPQYVVDVRLGILSGSLLSAVIGYFMLRLTSKENSNLNSTHHVKA